MVKPYDSWPYSALVDKLKESATLAEAMEVIFAMNRNYPGWLRNREGIPIPPLHGLRLCGTVSGRMTWTETKA